jgi:hypothetical protein
MTLFMDGFFVGFFPDRFSGGPLLAAVTFAA